MATRKLVRPLSAKITADSRYALGSPVTITFTVTNRSTRVIRALKWNTPVEGILSNCFCLHRGETEVPYDGIIIKRGDPGASDYAQLAAGESVSVQVDLADHYDLRKAGHYELRLRNDILDFFSVTGASKAKARPAAKHKGLKLSARKVSFEITGRGAPRVTVAAKQRAKEARVGAKRPRRMLAKATGPQTPLAPKIVGGTKAQRDEMLQVHNAAAIYTWGCSQALNANQSGSNANYVTWFGAYDATRFATVRSKYQSILNVFGSEQISYDLSQSGCESGIFAYTYKGSRTIYMCSAYFTASFSGQDSKVGTTIHELSHAVAYTDDHVYGRSSCKNLAKTIPAEAIDNADNYEFFAEATLPMNYGFDAAERLPNGKTYVTLGNIYIRYSDSNASKIDNGYPAPLQGAWGSLPGSFSEGFDSIVVLPDGKIYVTRGNEYIRYSDTSASKVDSAYTANLQGNWGTLPASFASGFDAVERLRNGKIYVTKGAQYIRYSDNNASKVDPGYPAQISGNWGNTNSSFSAGFDSIAVFGNGKIYVTKDGYYIRYSDTSASTIDSGYPFAIAGNWGTPPDS